MRLMLRWPIPKRWDRHAWGGHTGHSKGQLPPDSKARFTPTVYPHTLQTYSTCCARKCAANHECCAFQRRMSSSNL